MPAEETVLINAGNHDKPRPERIDAFADSAAMETASDAALRMSLEGHALNEREAIFVCA